MPKSLVVCCDGTWDTPVEPHQGQKTCTNVYKLWRGLADTDQLGSGQRTFYHEGLGTGGLPDRIFGGAFGAGVAHHIGDCYRFIALNYEPEDRIYLFGFSRGAYTARSVAGMVRNCGILKPENLDRLREAFQLYRDRGPKTSPDSVRAKQFRHDYAEEVHIHFIGVWDTVGSLGVPVRIPFWRPWWAFHDSVLSSTVKNAYHALAIDEQRAPFKPTVWTRKKQPPDQVLKQVWFAGCHRDIGGGEPDPDLADITLSWMVQRAESCGLAFEPDHFKHERAPNDRDRYEGLAIHPDLEGAIHQSRQGFFWKRVVRPYRRPIPYGGVARGYELSKQSVSNTAAERAQKRFDGYPPPQLAGYADRGLQITDVPIVSQPGQPV